MICEVNQQVSDIRKYKGTKQKMNQSDVNQVKEYLKKDKKHENDKDDD